MHDTGPPGLPLDRLTPAELLVYEELIQGYSTRTIASHLFLTEATVRSHHSSIYAKLDVRGRHELLGMIVQLTQVPEAVHSPPAMSTSRLIWSPSVFVLLGLAVLTVTTTMILPLLALVVGPLSAFAAWSLGPRLDKSASWAQKIAIAVGLVLTVIGLVLMMPVLALLLSSGGQSPI